MLLHEDYNYINVIFSQERFLSFENVHFCLLRESHMTGFNRTEVRFPMTVIFLLMSVLFRSEIFHVRANCVPIRWQEVSEKCSMFLELLLIAILIVNETF